VSLASPKHRRPSWVVAGVVLVALSALIGAWVFAATSHTMRVVVAARELSPGEVIGATDVRVVELGRSGDVRAIQPEQQSLILGRAARGPIPAGTVLNTDLFADRSQVVPAGQVVVGAALTSGAAPTAGLAAGDRVEVLGVVKSNGAAGSTSEATVLTSGTVWAVEPPPTGGGSGTWWVALLIPEGSQTAVAQAAADGLLRLSLVGASG
jgi:Flp pilus assembly protein CpaB